MEVKILSQHEVYALFQEQKNNQDYVDKNFKYLDLSYKGIDADSVFTAFSDDGEVMGMLQMGKSPYEKNLYWMKFVTVHPKFRQQGVARLLLSSLFSYLEKIEGAEVELSRYEPEGEVMISMVTELAQNYNLPIRHCKWGDPYQDAKQDYLSKGMIVLVNDPDSGFKGEGTILYFLDYEKPVKALVNIGDQKESLKVDLKNLQPKS
mgnify:CR=1 FL=1